MELRELLGTYVWAKEQLEKRIDSEVRSLDYMEGQLEAAARNIRNEIKEYPSSTDFRKKRLGIKATKRELLDCKSHIKKILRELENENKNKTDAKK